ncbi:hypothetical protein Ancab_033679 [Ancistrocladus abbreviatus]
MQQIDTNPRNVDAAASTAASNLNMTKKYSILSTKPLRKLNHPAEDSSFTHENWFQHTQNVKRASHRIKSLVNSLEVLTMINSIQLLGIDYCFTKEIAEALGREYVKFYEDHSHDLHEVALRFRLLRQEGYDVPADVFSRFKGRDGKFKQELSSDVRGLMSLFEASQMSTGEGILDEANEFSAQLLNASMKNLHQPLASAVSYALNHPHHCSLAKFTAQNFLHSLSDEKGLRHELQELAAMEFSRVQSIYQSEIHEILRWWKELGLAKELKFARDDQPLEWYMWLQATLPDPSLSKLRTELVKPLSLIYIIDDIFDVYGTLGDLCLFTEAVNSLEQLPDYMKICLKALYDITDKTSLNLFVDHGWNPRDCLRKAEVYGSMQWTQLCNAFLVEARWFASGQLPSAEDYLENGIVSSGVHVALVFLYFLLGEGINKDKVDHLNGNPSIITNSATIHRLWDDLGSAMDENQVGKDGSFIECYMNENKGSSFASARKHVTLMISDTWKRLNRGYLSPYPFPLTFRKTCPNFASQDYVLVTTSASAVLCIFIFSMVQIKEAKDYTMMKKATIVCDAIDYITELQGRVRELSEELLEMDTVNSEEEIQSRGDEKNEGENMKKCGIETEVKLIQIDYNKLWVKLVYNKKRGALTKLIEAMIGLGYEFTDTSLITSRGAVIVTSCLEGIYGVSFSVEETKELLLDIINTMCLLLCHCQKTMTSHPQLLLCLAVLVKLFSIVVAESILSMGSIITGKMELFGLSESPAPAPAPFGGWPDSDEPGMVQIQRVGKHHWGRSMAGGDVILGGFATAMVASIFCYIRITRRVHHQESKV